MSSSLSENPELREELKIFRFFPDNFSMLISRYFPDLDRNVVLGRGSEGGGVALDGRKKA